MSESARFVVAVVDDDDRTLESLADLLEAAGYDVRLYTSAKAVWTRGGLSDIDCLISDIGMPEMDGLSLIRATRRLPVCGAGELAAVALTAFARLPDRQAGLGAGIGHPQQGLGVPFQQLSPFTTPYATTPSGPVM